MKREELLKSKEYWTTKIQLDLFEMIRDYLKANKMNRTELAEKLGVSKGYISQILNGNFDHKVSKLVEIALALDKVPDLRYKDLQQYVDHDKYEIRHEQPFTELVYINLSVDQIKRHVIIENKKNIAQYRFNEPQGYFIN